MGVSVTLGNLKTRARERSDMINSTFISDSELTNFLNASYATYYDLLIEAYGEDYFADSATFTTTANTESYPLASDFYKILLVEIKISNNRYTTIQPFEFTDINRVSNYWPQAGRVVRYTYVPTFTAFAVDADSKDFVNGWEEFLVVDSAIKMLDKEESDTRVLQGERQNIVNRIKRVSDDRDIAFPQRISDVASYDFQNEINNLPGYRQTNVYNSMKYRIRGDNIYLRGY